MSTKDKTLCPSVPPWYEGSVAFGIVAGTVEEPKMMPLAELQPVTEELLALAEPAHPTEVFRFAGPCAGAKCLHFDKATTRCRLVEKTVRWTSIAVDKLVACPIRSSCKWWKQEGWAACDRCPQISTNNLARPDEHEAIVDPSVS